MKKRRKRAQIIMEIFTFKRKTFKNLFPPSLCCDWDIYLSGLECYWDTL